MVYWILLGTTFLWIGWYGFNAGSALEINHVALQAFMTTTIATASAMVSWMILETIHGNHPDMVGICTGALCGLVGITPAAGYVTNIGAALIGILCTLVSFIYITFIKPHLKYDDPLDVFGCHGVSGIIGSILVEFFATAKVNSNIHENGLFYGAGWHLLGIQLGGNLTYNYFCRNHDLGMCETDYLNHSNAGQQTSRKRGPRSKRTRRKC